MRFCSSNRDEAFTACGIELIEDSELASGSLYFLGFPASTTVEVFSGLLHGLLVNGRPEDFSIGSLIVELGLRLARFCGTRFGGVALFRERRAGSQLSLSALCGISADEFCRWPRLVLISLRRTNWRGFCWLSNQIQLRAGSGSFGHAGGGGRFFGGRCSCRIWRWRMRVRWGGKPRGSSS